MLSVIDQKSGSARQIVISGASASAFYEVPAGKVFRGSISINSNGYALINGVQFSSNLQSALDSVTLLAGTVVGSSNSNPVIMLGIEE